MNSTEDALKSVRAFPHQRSALGQSSGLVLIQIIASSVGGYLAGRLRTKWVSVHTHEVYFRDTAHDFLVWAVGVVITAAFLASKAASVAGGVARGRAMTMESAGPAQAQEGFAPSAYFTDKLLRPSAVNVNQDYGSLCGEVGLILANAIRKRSMPAGDRAFLAQVGAARTGGNEAEGNKRVDDVFAQAREAATRRAKRWRTPCTGLFWLF